MARAWRTGIVFNPMYCPSKPARLAMTMTPSIAELTWRPTAWSVMRADSSRCFGHQQRIDRRHAKACQHEADGAWRGPNSTRDC